MALEPIDPTQLTAVMGGSMQFDPGLLNTVASLTQVRKRAKQPAEDMQKAVTTIGSAVSTLATTMQQAQQQSSQAMMQALPQMLASR